MSAPSPQGPVNPQGPVKWGVHLSMLCPELVALCGHLGFEWLFLDAERRPVTPQSCRELVRAADGAGLTCLVRLQELERSSIEGFLDAGVPGILAPHVSTAEEARVLVAAVKARQGSFTAALVETESGIDNLEQIMATPGLDFVAIGPNDLARSMGIQAGGSDPRVRAIVESAQALIRSRGKPQLAVVSNVDRARHAVTAGATMIAVSDAALLGSAGRSFLESVRADSDGAQGCQGARGTASHVIISSIGDSISDPV